MPVSADIYGQIAPVQPSNLLKNYADVMAIQNAQQQGQMNALKMDEYQRGVQRSNKLRDLITGLPADATDDQRINVLKGAGFFDEADKLDKSLLERKKVGAEVGDKESQTRERDFKLAKSRLDIAGQALNAVRQNPTLDVAHQVIDYLGQNGVWTPQQVAQYKAQTAANPEGIAQMAETAFRAALDAKDQLEKTQTNNIGGSTVTLGIDPVTGKARTLSTQQNTQSPDNAASNARQASDNAAARAIQERGQNMADARAREANSAAMSKPFEVTGPDGNPILVQQDKQGNIVPVQGYKPKGGAEKPLNDAQSKALLFGSRMRESDKVLAELAKSGTLSSVPGSRSGFGVGPVINALSSSKQQQLDQAKRDFVNAVLRRESGAVIADSEFESADKQYFPQIGDRPDVIAQKARNRKLAIDGILAEVPENRRDSLKPQPALPSADDLRKQADNILKGG